MNAGPVYSVRDSVDHPYIHAAFFNPRSVKIHFQNWGEKTMQRSSHLPLAAQPQRKEVGVCV